MERGRPTPASADRFVAFLSMSLQPLSRVEDPAFRSLLKTAQSSYQMPSRKYLSTKLLPAKTATLQQHATDKLKQVTVVSLTVDIWSSKSMRAYIVMTAHYINTFQPQSVMLACQRFRASHTAESILSSYQQIINNFDIDTKVFAVITDNEANLLKAFVILHGTPTDYHNDDDDDEDDGDDMVVTDACDDLDHLLKHIPCFLHTLQLVVKDGLREMGAASTVITKASEPVSHGRHSCLASDLLEGELKLQVPIIFSFNQNNIGPISNLYVHNVHE